MEEGEICGRYKEAPGKKVDKEHGIKERLEEVRNGWYGHGTSSDI